MAEQLNLIDIPRYVDSQQQILFWELDELVPLCVLFAGGIVLRQLTIAILLMWPATRLLARWKDSRLDGAMTHLTYAHGFPLNKVFKTPYHQWIS